MSPQPVTRSNEIGITEEQWAEVDQLLSGEIAASQGQFNGRLQRDLRQQQFQVSLQRDIERSLSNNPVSAINLPVPRAEFDSSEAPYLASARVQFADDWNAHVRALNEPALRRDIDRVIGTQVDTLLDPTVDPTVARYRTEILRAQSSLAGRLTDSRVALDNDPTTWLPGRAGTPDGAVVVRPDGSRFIQDGDYLKPIGNADGLIEEQQRLWNNMDEAYAAIPFEVRTGKTQLQATADALSIASLALGAGEVVYAVRGLRTVAAGVGIIGDSAEYASDVLEGDWQKLGKDIVGNVTFNSLEDYLGPAVTGLEFATNVGQAIGETGPHTLPPRPSREQLQKQMSDREWAIKQGLNPMVVEWVYDNERK